jgi:hypothetical protein
VKLIAKFQLDDCLLSLIFIIISCGHWIPVSNWPLDRETLPQASTAAGSKAAAELRQSLTLQIINNILQLPKLHILK